MPLYASQNLGDSISEVVLFDDSQDDAIRGHEHGTQEPTLKTLGLLHSSVNNTLIDGATDGGALVSPATHDHAFLLWSPTSIWRYLMDARYPQINAGGTVKMIAALPMGAQKIEDLAAGTASSDAVRVDQVMLRGGANAATGDMNMGSNKVTNLAAPTNPNDAARLTDLASDQAEMVQAPTLPILTGPSDASRYDPGFTVRHIRVRVYANLLASFNVDVDTDVSIGLNWPDNATELFNSGGGNPRETVIDTGIEIQASPQRNIHIHVKWGASGVGVGFSNDGVNIGNATVRRFGTAVAGGYVAAYLSP